jgi:hypothetical protein
MPQLEVVGQRLFMGLIAPYYRGYFVRMCSTNIQVLMNSTGRRHLFETA